MLEEGYLNFLESPKLGATLLILVEAADLGCDTTVR